MKRERGRLFKMGLYVILSLWVMASVTACAATKPALESITEVSYVGIPSITTLDKYSLQGDWDKDDIIFGGKFRFDLQGSTEPITSASGGGVTFEKKEATEGERPPDFPDNLKYYVITGVKWENFVIQRNYQKDKKDWRDWWEKTKDGDVEYKNFTLTYLDKKGNDTSRYIKGYNAFPVRYDVINVDSRSGSAAVRETLEMVVEHYEYADGDEDNGASEEAQPQGFSAKGYDTTQSTDVTQISKFNLDIVSGDEKTPTGGWWSITGGDHCVEVITYTTGADPDEQKKPGQGYFEDITVRGPFCKDREKVMDWVYDTAKGKRDRKDLTLEFLDDKEQPVMTFTLMDCLPVSYSPPAVSSDNHTLLEERFTFLVIKIDQK